MTIDPDRLTPPALVALTVVTVTNYVWQVPYAIHQYGRAWVGLPRVSGLLIVTAVWFLVGVMRYARRRRGGTALLASFLAIEALFYVLHNLTGAFGHDLPMTNPIVLIASVLGYLNLAAAVAALASFVWLSHLDRKRTAQPDAGQLPEQVVEASSDEPCSHHLIEVCRRCGDPNLTQRPAHAGPRGHME